MILRLIMRCLMQGMDISEIYREVEPMRADPYIMKSAMRKKGDSNVIGCGGRLAVPFRARH